MDRGRWWPRRRAGCSARWPARGRCRRAASGRRRAVPGTCVHGPEPDAFEQAGDAGVDLAARADAGQAQRHGDVVGHRLGHQQVEVLKDHPDALAEAPQAVGIQRGDVSPLTRMRPPEGSSRRLIRRSSVLCRRRNGRSDRTLHRRRFPAASVAAREYRGRRSDRFYGLDGIRSRANLVGATFVAGMIGESPAFYPFAGDVARLRRCD